MGECDASTASNKHHCKGDLYFFLKKKKKEKKNLWYITGERYVKKTFK